jgi:[acyl-carrier-protein] S-malonyltransferase
MRLAFLFPGQGAQVVGMGKALAEAFPAAREVFAEADEALGFRLSEICWDGPAERLRETRYTQPALLTHSVAAWRLVERSGLRPEWTAGHSLGEYSACVAAGALEFRDAVRLVHLRGTLMFEAGQQRPGTMAALLGVDREVAGRICAAAAPQGVVVPANFNAPGQIVISGERPAVEEAVRIGPELGAKRAVMLDVSGAFHSPLMESAARGLGEALDRTTFREPRCPVVANVSAAPLSRADEIREALKRQVLGAVRWEDSMRLLLESGAEGFVEIGTGRVLRGLLRSIEKTAASWNIEDPATLEATLGELGAQRPVPEGA